MAAHVPPAIVQKVLPALLENQPGGHRVHVAAAAVEAPELPLLPAGHTVPPAHDAAPTNEDHVPGGHGLQASKLEAPRTAKVPGPQTLHKWEGKFGQLHDVAPYWFVKMPAGHSVHAPSAAVVAPDIPKDPGRHMVPWHERSPAAAQVPAVQFRHVADELEREPVGPEEPAPQAWPRHAVRPATPAYKPGAHVWQFTATPPAKDHEASVGLATIAARGPALPATQRKLKPKPATHDSALG